MSEWKPIETLDHDNLVIFGSWFEDAANGYFGGDRWNWIASGCRGEGLKIWIDFTDDEHSGELYQKPTHWKEFDPLDPPKPTT